MSCKIFEKYANEYDAWFDENQAIYLSELNLVRQFIPQGANGIEIGVGTGRFAQPLNIKIGLEPSTAMAEIAKTRGIKVFQGIAEDLASLPESYDFVLMVTVLCFLKEPLKVLKEVYRIINHRGALVIAFIDKATPLGQLYEEKKQQSKFFKEAKFYSTDEVLKLLKEAGFSQFEISQTLFDLNSKDIQPFSPGYGEGLFVGIKAI